MQPTESAPCERCNGTGCVWSTAVSIALFGAPIMPKCSACNGTGVTQAPVIPPASKT
jgi:DnaJ-class molecular chaperone